MIDCIANWSSIIGLVISLATLIYAFFIDKKVKLIKRKVLFNTRVEPLLKDLGDFSNNIKNLYGDFDNNKKELKVEIVKCKVHLESILSKIPNENQSEFKLQIKQLKKIQKSTLGDRPENYKKRWLKKNTIFKSKDDIWEIYVGLIESVNRLNNLIKDKNII